MKGSVAIITGGGTGIGAAVVRQLAARGVRCVINYASSREAAEALVHEVGEGAIAVKADVADDAACGALVAAAMDTFGRVDMLVNNAGRTKFAHHEDMDAISADDFLDLYRLNVVGAFQMVRAAAPALRKGSSSAVVNIASIAGVHGIGSSIPYAASKGAMITMTKSLARVLAPRIRVNAVAPGYVATGWYERERSEEDFARLNDYIASQLPMAFAPAADDIAGPVVHLLDPASRAITARRF